MVAFYVREIPGERQVSSSANEAIRLTPEVDVVEREEEIVVLLDMPGVDRKSLRVWVEDGILHLQGRKNIREEKGGFLLKEIPEAVYERAFRLTEDLDTEKISARYERGVLEIRLKKKVANKPVDIVIS